THIAENAGYRFRILEAVLEVNRLQQQRIVEKVSAMLGGNPSGKTVAVLGITFKPNTDDTRDAPALTIIPALQRLGVKIRAHDPIVGGMDLDGVTWGDDAYDTAKGADCLVLLTEWNEYRNLDFEQLKGTMGSAAFVDGRNIYDPRNVRDYGFQYVGVGRSFEASAPWAMQDVVVREAVEQSQPEGAGAEKDA
ncbi:MAG: UDP-glucose/GDP-mannose dehydrogenase family protein, partial [Gemmatimonadetes bacterium]|nr:UDP-glucose/GDP-mannose dehydrogenase family protein [Gemmatimonadota bacterium]